MINYETPTMLRTKDGRQYREVIKRGAARRTVAEAKKIRALLAHDKNKILGRTDHKTLELREDESGVEVVRLDIPRTTLGADTLADIENGNIEGWSFGFPPDTVKDKWMIGPDKVLTREIYELDLSEVSLTSVASYPGTFAEVRDSDLTITEPVDQFQIDLELIEKMILCE